MRECRGERRQFGTRLQRGFPSATAASRAALPGRRRRKQHAAHVHRGHAAGPRSRSGARHDDPPGVLFQAAAHGTGACVARASYRRRSHAAAPPDPLDDGSSFQTKIHTANAILCGDFNLEAHEPEYDLIQQPFAQGRLWDSRRLLHGEAPRRPTFRLFDREYGPDPIACDFILVSDGLKDRSSDWTSTARPVRRITSRSPSTLLAPQRS